MLFRDQSAEYWYNTSSGLTYTEQTLKVTGYGDILQCFSYNSGITTNILTVKDDDTSDLLTVFNETNDTLFKISNDGYFTVNGKVISSSGNLDSATFGTFEIASIPKISGSSMFIDYYLSTGTTSGSSMIAGSIIAVWNSGSLAYSGTTSVELNGPVTGATILISMVSDNIVVNLDVFLS